MFFFPPRSKLPLFSPPKLSLPNIRGWPGAHFIQNNLIWEYLASKLIKVAPKWLHVELQVSIAWSVSSFHLHFGIYTLCTHMWCPSCINAFTRPPFISSSTSDFDLLSRILAAYIFSRIWCHVRRFIIFTRIHLSYSVCGCSVVVFFAFVGVFYGHGVSLHTVSPFHPRASLSWICSLLCLQLLLFCSMYTISNAMKACYFLMGTVIPFPHAPLIFVCPVKLNLLCPVILFPHGPFTLVSSIT